jgi:hypothetical protein
MPTLEVALPIDDVDVGGRVVGRLKIRVSEQASEWVTERAKKMNVPSKRTTSIHTDCGVVQLRSWDKGGKHCKRVNRMNIGGG